MWDEGRTNCRRSKDVLLLLPDAAGVEVEVEADAGILFVVVVVATAVVAAAQQEEGDRVVINAHGRCDSGPIWPGRQAIWI
jgi:hypothetical protein